MKTILSCVFKLEVNRMMPTLSDEAAFRDRNWIFGEEAIRARVRDANLEMTGFMDVFDPEEEYELRPLFFLEAQPGGVVSGDVYDLARSSLLRAVAQCKKEAAERGEDPAQAPAAILLALHGAMVSQGHEDADGDLLESLRQAVGPDRPIFATLDLHVNLTRKMAENANALWPCENYPHTDYRVTGKRAAACLLDALQGKKKPVMRIASLPMLFPYTPTEGKEFLPYYRKIRALNELPGVLEFRFAHGFFASDVTEGGPAAVAVTDGDPALARSLAEDFAREIWDHRAEFYRSFYTPEEALAEAKRLIEAGAGTPIVLAEVADNPGSGATADGVKLLEAMVNAGIEAMFALICDPGSARRCREAGEGAELELELGGKAMPELTGGPLRVRAKVLALSRGEFIQESPYMKGSLMRMGDAALVQIGCVKTVVSSLRLQPTCRGIFHLFGLAPEKCPLVAVKSAVHYRASYEPVAAAVLEVETPALGPMDPRSFPLRHAPKDFYPLNEKA
ncbi:MAG: M81 family metallopeptidase [Clostridia bacterium]|nr:M81 family metallopeptidase [Clostridia bacterium]